MIGLLSNNILGSAGAGSVTAIAIAALLLQALPGGGAQAITQG